MKKLNCTKKSCKKCDNKGQFADWALGFCLFVSMTGLLYVGLKTLTIILGG